VGVSLSETFAKHSMSLLELLQLIQKVGEGLRFSTLVYDILYSFHLD